MKILKKIIVKLGILNIFSFPMYLFRVFKIDNNKIFCVNFSGKGYGDNPKYIVEELLKSKHYKIIWAVRKKSNNFPLEICQVKLYSLRYFYELTTSKIWINNSRFPLFVRKRKGQYYIQTWHGGIGLKKVEQLAIDKLSDYYKKAAPHDSKMIDVAISNSEYRTNIYINSFWYHGKVKEYGCPRNDIFFDTDKIKLKTQIAQQYGFSSNAKIIMYAPTFRVTAFNYFQIPIETILDSLQKQENKEYVFLIRLHPRLKCNKIFKDSRIFDVTSYSDIDELLLISDLLISDYSSIIFDFLFTNNPVYLYAPDYDSYVDERGLNFEYKKLPFSISYSSKELVAKIINQDYKNYSSNLKKFLQKMKIIDDGNASKRVAKLIESIVGDNHEKI